jgi:hypothetical protein
MIFLKHKLVLGERAQKRIKVLMQQLLRLPSVNIKFRRCDKGMTQTAAVKISNKA